MAILTSKTDVAGAVGDTFSYSNGTWVIVRVDAPGQFVWEPFVDTSVALSADTAQVLEMSPTDNKLLLPCQSRVPAAYSVPAAEVYICVMHNHIGIIARADTTISVNLV